MKPTLTVAAVLLVLGGLAALSGALDAHLLRMLELHDEADR